MNTENILFRGKDEDGSWHFGYYYKTPFAGNVAINATDCLIHWYVIPETVGQYTGRSIGDKKIFDGDILQNGTGIYVVCWDEKHLHWHVVSEKGVVCFNLNTLLTNEKRPCKLVGNIHDNPDLLKG